MANISWGHLERTKCERTYWVIQKSVYCTIQFSEILSLVYLVKCNTHIFLREKFKSAAKVIVDIIVFIFKFSYVDSNHKLQSNNLRLFKLWKSDGKNILQWVGGILIRVCKLKTVL